MEDPNMLRDAYKRVMSNAFVRAREEFLCKVEANYNYFDAGVIDNKEYLRRLQPEESNLVARFNDLPDREMELFWPGLEPILENFRLHETLVKLK